MQESLPFLRLSIVTLESFSPWNIWEDHASHLPWKFLLSLYQRAREREGDRGMWNAIELKTDWRISKDQTGWRQGLTLSNNLGNLVSKFYFYEFQYPPLSTTELEGTKGLRRRGSGGSFFAWDYLAKASSIRRGEKKSLICKINVWAVQCV